MGYKMIDLKSLASYETKRLIPSGLKHVELRYSYHSLSEWYYRARPINYVNDPHPEDTPRYSVPNVGFTCPDEDMQRLLDFVYKTDLLSRDIKFRFSSNHGVHNESGQDCVGFLLYSHWVGTINLDLWRMKEDLSPYGTIDGYGRFPRSFRLDIRLTEAVHTLLTLDSGRVSSVELRVTHSEGEEIIRYPS